MRRYQNLTVQNKEDKCPFQPEKAGMSKKAETKQKFNPFELSMNLQKNKALNSLQERRRRVVPKNLALKNLTNSTHLLKDPFLKLR